MVCFRGEEFVSQKKQYEREKYEIKHFVLYLFFPNFRVFVFRLVKLAYGLVYNSLYIEKLEYLMT